MQSSTQMSTIGAKRVFLLSTLMLSYGISGTSGAFLRSPDTSLIQGKEEAPIPDPTCKRGVASPDLKVCCTDECGSCGTHKLCNDPGKFHEVTGKLADNCCKERILKKAVSCEKDHPPCVLADSYKKELETYEQDLPKRHAMQDCNKAVPKTYAVHELAIGKGEFLSKLYVEGKTKYEDAKAIAIKVEKLCEDKAKESQALVDEYAAKIAGATDEDKVKDDTGVSKLQKWEDKEDNEKAEIKFYDQLIKNAKEVEDAATAGIKNVEKLIGEVKDAKDLDDKMLKLDALLDDAEVVHKDAEALWKQWNDSSKDYSCGVPPIVEHAKTECDNGNTKFARKCTVICQEGYDGNQSQNLLRCNRQGKFGKQLYGEWNGLSTCMGKVCGKPPQIKKAQTVIQDIRYPNVASYHCYEGYSVNGSASGDKVFDVPCGKLGSFLEDAVAHQCQPISCGSAPVEKNTEPIKGEFHYTDIITYKCDKGHTVDETAGGRRSFSTSCQATGEFNKGLGCRPVRCGKPPDFANTKDPATKEEQYYGAKLSFTCRPGYSLTQQPGGPTKFELMCASNGEFEVAGGATVGELALPKCQPVSAGIPPAVPHGNFQRQEMFFGDTVMVTSDTGYSYLGNPSEGLFFEISVTAEGTFQGYEKFLAVRCSKPPAITHATPSTNVMQRYGDVVTYECDSGYSTDKTASDAAKTFSVFCEADSYFSNILSCQNIDDCIGHTCGPHGDCVDHLNNYTCDCDSGFAPHLDNETRELVCGNINDCGPEACGVGKCLDLVNDYKCDCPTGFVQKEIQGDDGKTEKTCVAVLCGTPPEVDNTHTVPAEAANVKFSFPEIVKYNCDLGHSLDGKSSGEKSFEIECQASKSFTQEKECKPIECNSVPKVEHASADKSSATYNQSVRIDCDKGHTVDGSANGDKGFTVTCKESGSFGDVQQCKPIRCGVPDDIANSFRPSDSMVYADVVTYTCGEGFTLDATPDGKSEFDVECQVDGSLTKTKQCLPKVCGKIKDINALHITEFDVDHDSQVHYPGHVEVMCRDGYTVGGDAHGARSFTVKCLSSGSFQRFDKRECEPVICPVPPPLPNATLMAILPGSMELEGSPPNLNFEKKAVYECPIGFTAGGEPDAPTTFDVQCLPNGDLSAPAPDMQCRNVNDCEHHTCGKKGTCIDLIGEAPAYTCDCEHGYEIQEQSNGEKQCGNIDDCQGKDCGAGVCEDMVGDYTCICPSGHYVGFKDGSKTCLPVKCADEAPGLENGKMLSSHSSGGVFFPESIRYKCDKGYSTDGSALGSKRKFHGLCKADGALFGMMSCQKLSCGSPHVLPYTTLVSPGSQTASIDYDEKAKYKCEQGYTLTGTAGGATEFEVTCPDNGILSDPQVCLPVSCGQAPRIPKSKPGLAGEILYGMRLIYTCDVGYTLDSSVGGSTSFRRSCQEDGTFGEQGATESEPCKPISAGQAPQIDNAVLAEYDGQPANMEMRPTLYYPKGVEYRCLPGFSTTGSTYGATKITARVTSFGSLSPALPSECKEISLSIGGLVSDARNSGRLSGVTVSIEGTSKSATTSGGYFTLTGVAPGTHTLVYEKSGMIKATKSISVQTDVYSGGSADSSMSPEMSSDEWRIVVTWESTPRDLDTHLKWNNGGTHIYYGRRSASGSGLTANLEVDDTNGNGPETTFLRNMGRCWGSGSRCDMTYEIYDWSRTGNMANTDVEVTVFSGSSVAGHFKIGDCRGTVYSGGNWWKVFTIDGKNNRIKWTCAQSLNMAQLNTTQIEHNTPAKLPLIARPRKHV